MSFFQLIIGFLLLIKGADYFVEGSSSLAKTMKIPSVIIGLTIVAMGTSAPEASVSISAALMGNNDIALSNVIGSNIFNGMVVVGICALIQSFSVNKDIAKRDLPINIVISILLTFLIYDGSLSRLEGLILLFLMMTYLFLMIRSALKNKIEEDNIKPIPLYLSIIYIVGGLIAIVVGGDFVVVSASSIATSLGLSQNFIGLTIVAIGTSLPELVTSIVATLKGDRSLAFGNAVGSNIFNILFILGISAFITPLSVASETVVDAVIMTISAVLLYLLAKTRDSINKKEGIACLIFYIVYTIFLFVR